jgi:hypothetical protein
MAADSTDYAEDGTGRAGFPWPGFNGPMRGNGARMTIIEAPRELDAVDEEVEGDADGSRPAVDEVELADGEAVLDLAPAPPVDDTVVQGSEDGHGVDPAYVVEAHAAVPAAEPEAAPELPDGTLTDAAYLVEDTGPDGPPVDTAPPGSLAAAVADHLAGRVPDPADGRSESAQAVLDVLRAAGWSDAGETQVLQAEVTRLRELLDMVVRDHRVRVANDASGHAEQAHWLVPLLRAAHGVSFGTLGAKVHLRTAVQDVPPEVLSSAGLRIDDSGPMPEPEYR